MLFLKVILIKLNTLSRSSSKFRLFLVMLCAAFIIFQLVLLLLLPHHSPAQLFNVQRKAAPESLKLVNVLYRHGDRSPVHVYPTDPHQAETWPLGLGQLSNIGKKQHFALGQYMRKRYGGLLNDTYLPWELHVNSSDVDRCLMSAAAHLAGLYPPRGASVWREELLWQPVPIHSMPILLDNELAQDRPCARYAELSDQKQKDFVLQQFKENRAFMEFLYEKTGYNRSDYSILDHVGDALFVERTHNRKLPHWVNDSVYETLSVLKTESFALTKIDTAEMIRLRGGPMLSQWLSNLQQYMKPGSDRRIKMYMYSAHDSTVVTMLGSLLVYNGHIPPYAACLLLELHEVAGSWAVAIYYKNDSSADAYPLTVPGCAAHLCRWDKFFSLVKQNVQSNWEQACQNDANEDSRKMQPGLSATVAVVLAIALLILMAGTVYYCVSTRRRHHRTSRTVESGRGLLLNADDVDTI